MQLIRTRLACKGAGGRKVSLQLEGDRGLPQAGTDDSLLQNNPAAFSLSRGKNLLVLVLTPPVYHLPGMKKKTLKLALS